MKTTNRGWIDALERENCHRRRTISERILIGKDWQRDNRRERRWPHIGRCWLLRRGRNALKGAAEASRIPVCPTNCTTNVKL